MWGEWEITGEDESGRQASGMSNFERFDPATGTSVLLVDKSDLTGF